MKTAKVIKCEVEDCVYNRDNCCHTIAITVGDGTNPKCDTFWHSTMKGGDAATLADVGACKVAVCKYNKSFECTTAGIRVGYQGGVPDCLSFESK